MLTLVISLKNKQLTYVFILVILHYIMEMNLWIYHFDSYCSSKSIITNEVPTSKIDFSTNWKQHVDKMESGCFTLKLSKFIIICFAVESKAICFILYMVKVTFLVLFLRVHRIPDICSSVSFQKVKIELLIPGLFKY